MLELTCFASNNNVFYDRLLVFVSFNGDVIRFYANNSKYSDV